MNDNKQLPAYVPFSGFANYSKYFQGGECEEKPSHPQITKSLDITQNVSTIDIKFQSYETDLHVSRQTKVDKTLD